jgi:hypothetical protein
MYSLCTLANEKALNDLKIFLFTLQLWNENIELYLYCDTYIYNYLETNNIYKYKLHKRKVLDNYNIYNRKEMESISGKTFTTLWEDFMCEKMNLMNWAHETHDKVLFCDADICFLGPLLSIPDEYQIGLSPHEIRSYDEQKFGIYNGGFVYSACKDIPNVWRKATYTSRYFEQASLEDLKEFSTYTIPIQNNYGWWRLLQGKESVQILKSKWSIKRDPNGCGIYVEGKPLLSIHTHWKTNDMATILFNDFVKGFLEKLKSVEKTKKFLNFLKSA